MFLVLTVLTSALGLGLQRTRPISVDCEYLVTRQPAPRAPRGM